MNMAQECEIPPPAAGMSESHALSDALLVQLHSLKRQLLTKVLKVEWAISHKINEVENKELYFYRKKTAGQLLMLPLR